MCLFVGAILITPEEGAKSSWTLNVKYKRATEKDIHDAKHF